MTINVTELLPLNQQMWTETFSIILRPRYFGRVTRASSEIWVKIESNYRSVLKPLRELLISVQPPYSGLLRIGGLNDDPLPGIIAQ